MPEQGYRRAGSPDLAQRRRTCVSSPRLKSKTSSLSSFRMTMLFSHSGSLVWLAAQMSPMKLGHLCGQSCFSTCAPRQTPGLSAQPACMPLAWPRTAPLPRDAMVPALWVDGGRKTAVPRMRGHIHSLAMRCTGHRGTHHAVHLGR